MSDDDTPDSDDAADALETAGQAVKTAAELAKAASALADGNAAGALQSGLGTAGGATNLAGAALGTDEAEAREGLRTAGAVAGAASSLVGAGRSVAGGDIGGAAGRLGGATDASRYIVPEGEAASVLSGARQGAGAAQQAGAAAQGLAGGAGGQAHDDVELHIEVTGADEAWRVTQFSITEALNAIPSATFEAHYAGHLEVSELLHAGVLVLGRETPERASARFQRHHLARGGARGGRWRRCLDARRAGGVSPRVSVRLPDLSGRDDRREHRVGLSGDPRSSEPERTRR